MRGNIYKQVCQKIIPKNECSTINSKNIKPDCF